MKKKIVSSLVISLAIAAAGSAFALTGEEQMGRHVYLDKDLSLNSTQSCATCHHRSAGYADPTNSRDPYTTVASLGDDGVSRGGRNAPTAAYCGFSPILHQDAAGEWIGGMFWDGRATGETLGDPLAEQAQGPPLNPVEMNMPSAAAVVERVAAATYATLFTNYFGPDFFAIYGDDDTPDGFLDFKVDYAYEMIARMVAAYERSTEVSPFDSKFDRNMLTAQELRGKDLVAQHCAGCHAMDTVAGAAGPLFTTYGYANIGLPENPLINNPGDIGLGAVKPGEDGKFKIPTLRNVALTAPYGHNGSFATLRDMVAFINDRSGFTPDVATNLTDLTGNMGLTDAEIDDIVAFLNALTDGSGKTRMSR